MAPVPEEAFEPTGEQAAEMGAESVLGGEAPASTAEASSVEEPAGAGEVSGCAEEVTNAVSEARRGRADGVPAGAGVPAEDCQRWCLPHRGLLK